MDQEGGSSDSCYYSILGIRRDASFSDVRLAYRKLALKWHPDRCEKNQLSPDVAKQRFQKIQEAYSVLSDQPKRAMYNAGMLSLYDNEDDEKMKEFMRELFSTVDHQQKNEERPEDLHKTFVEMFGKDLANMQAAGKDDRNSNDLRASSQCR